jgi:hypothetical protein
VKFDFDYYDNKRKRQALYILKIKIPPNLPLKKGGVMVWVLCGATPTKDNGQ